MRQRLEYCGVDGEHWIKQVGNPDVMGFGRQPEQIARSVKTPGSATFGDFDAVFVVAIEKFVGYLTGGVLVGQFEGFPIQTIER